MFVRIETELCPLKSVSSVCLDLTDIEARRDVIAKGQIKVIKLLLGYLCVT